MVTVDRWKNAQDYEAKFWDSTAQSIEGGETAELEWYRWRADQLIKRLDELELSRLTEGESVVLEVGSGPVGVVSFFPAARKHAVDPLQSFYSAQQALTSPRSSDVAYIEGLGEALSFADDSCDLVIIENCIDHVRSVQDVMKELRRVLRPGGVLYLTANCRTRIGYYVHRALSRFEIDRGHPHTFTSDRIQHLVEKFDFDIQWIDSESYLSSMLADLRTPTLRSRAKALLGVSEFTASLIAMKPIAQ